MSMLIQNALKFSNTKKMLINEKTKIAALLKHHPDALETIVSIAPDFKKLRNPILRKLMAGRTSIAMASKIGGVKPEDFFKALAPLGFEYDASGVAVEEVFEESPMPDYLKNLDRDKLVNFDVREMIAKGDDPLRSIQDKVKALTPGQVLLIVNSFEPVPLIKLLERQGFKAYVRQVDADTYETFFYKEGESGSKAVEDDAAISTSGDWEAVLARFEGRMEEIDVRHLEAPMPMMTILEALDSLPADKALYVHHKRIPVFLLGELNERKFEYRIKEVAEGEVYLLIFKEQ